MNRWIAVLMMSIVMLSACASEPEKEDRSLIDSILRGPESRAPEPEMPELVPFSNGPSEPPVPLEELQ
jgi:hypothetical protein